MNELLERVKRLLLSPRTELPNTIGEPGDLKTVLRYVLVLAAIGPVAEFLSHGLVGTYVPETRIFGITTAGGFYRAPGPSLVGSLLGFGISVGAWWFYAFVLAQLAPTFGGRKDLGAAYKLAACSGTALWIANALVLLDSVPYLHRIGLAARVAGLGYSVFLTVLGAPMLLKTPEDKAVAHALASAGIVVAGAIVASWLMFNLLLSGALFATA